MTLDPVDYMAQTRDTYQSLGYADYQWADNPGTPPWAPRTKALADSSIALIASGGIYARGQVAFTHKDDTSHREIPTDIAMSELRVTHFAYDMADARRDPNVVLPLEPLRALLAEGAVGGLTSHALTFMGGIYSQRRLGAELIPVLVNRVQEMEADLVLLVPV
jgi:D-proline reductase (dithiol) PrdB